MPFTGTFERDPLAEEFQANRFNIWTLCFRTAYCSLRSRSKHAPHVADFEEDKIRPSAPRATRKSLGSGSRC